MLLELSSGSNSNNYDKIISLSHFYKPTTFTVDGNIQQLSLRSTFAG